MTPRERRSLAVGCLLLLIAGSVRTLLRSDAEAGPPPAEDALAALLEESAAAAEEADRRGRPLEQGERIDPNRASEVEIDRLPGVGPAVARAIVRSREADGAFRSASDLERVRGIGPATVQRLGPWLDFSAGIPSRLRRARARATERIPLGTASVAELETISGIGPALAARIVAERDRVGGFQSWEDVLAVSGIGPGKLEVLREAARLGG